MSPGGFLLHIAGLSVGKPIPTQVHDVVVRSRVIVLPALGPPAGTGPWSLEAPARVEGVLSGNVVAQHDHPVLQVADGASHTAGSAVQTLLRAKLPLQRKHGSKWSRAAVALDVSTWSWVQGLRLLKKSLYFSVQIHMYKMVINIINYRRCSQVNTLQIIHTCKQNRS